MQNKTKINNFYIINQQKKQKQKYIYYEKTFERKKTNTYVKIKHREQGPKKYSIYEWKKY